MSQDFSQGLTETSFFSSFAYFEEALEIIRSDKSFYANKY